MTWRRYLHSKKIHTYGRFITIVMPLLTFIVIIGIIGMQLLHLSFAHAASRPQPIGSIIESTLLVPGALSRSHSGFEPRIERRGEVLSDHAPRW